MAANPAGGIVDLISGHSFTSTVESLEELLRAKGVKLFAVVDHSGEAEQAGMHMRPAKLLIFGNPQAGTPLMIASPRIAIDLPMKILVWEDEEGQVRLSYNTAAWLQTRHSLRDDLAHVLEAAEALAKLAAQ